MPLVNRGETPEWKEAGPKLAETASFVLGIDGGGTRTTAWVAGSHGKVEGRAVAGPSNPLKVGFAAAQRELLRAATAAIRQAGLRRSRLDAVCVGLAGSCDARVHRRMQAWLQRAIPARRHLLTSDAAIALEAALGEAPGVIVIAGTGSIAYGRDGRGRTRRVGGWGIPFDDCGSGYDLGRKAVAAALQQADGRGPRTALTRTITRALRLKRIDDVIRRPLSAAEIAALAPLVLRAASSGDQVARRLCDQAGSDLATLAVALLKRMGCNGHGIRVTCAGGVFRASSRVRQSFARALRQAVPGVKISVLRREPVQGAVMLARALASADARCRVNRRLPKMCRVVTT